MEEKSQLMVKVLLNRFYGGSLDPVVRVMSEDDAQQIAAIDVESQDTSPLFALPFVLLQKVHYSWLASVIEKFPKSIRPLILSSLPENQASKLSKLLKQPRNTLSLTSSAKVFVLSKFYDSFKEPHVLPMEYLRQTPLSPLLQLTKEELVELIDFLGIHDLADHIKHTIDKRSLKALYLCLSPKKQQFLRICMHQKDLLQVPKLDLEGWIGDKTKLELILHRRGLQRLGKSLSTEDPHFIWYLIHCLDTGRGAILSKFSSRKESPGVTPLLVQQVINALNFLKKKSEA